MKAIDIIKLLDQWAFPYLIDKWDNTGFQIGDPEREVSKILISLDLDREVFLEAMNKKVQMIVTHHPIIFKSLSRITKESYKESLIYDIIKEDLVVYNAHTNLDLVPGGVNDALANTLGIKNHEPLRVNYRDPLYKLVVFVPKDYAPIIRKVLGDMGAGWIGNYSHCTYNVEGMGTFLPLRGTKPFIGKVYELEEVEEVRIETIVEDNNLDEVLKEMIRHHPYEEVAYDIYPLKNEGKAYGYGRIGSIKEMALLDYLDIIKRSLEVDRVIVYGNRNRIVERVAVCGGSGASFIYDAYKRGADLYITGDVKYHDAQYANELGLTLVDAGHYHTEKVILPIIKDYLDKILENKVEIYLHDKSSPPFAFY
ncbi:Nif3-like dinuclear metal center hexameric protein [Tepidimicrobium xylanilyticum]|uniref:GTP cyclohydrolase 1 type 2 homolog n=1 Tax=Tepidimicrobium xylanilyticum TaxID=1123352 RepID=A0A1H2T1Q7_9FIRM|nr:Nif3-like dinuclear metal center hexameric protein [Tepidimicrobium xylanilyticum]GMG96060.1 GTP cyclohydrolase 1 type 2 [Tepidimicrobium xylanilyticum]SDW37219.1 dinuclear metal center protein, YbgI/SA1388 family [Tepidimicrobium xylanilyticum]